MWGCRLPVRRSSSKLCFAGVPCGCRKEQDMSGEASPAFLHKTLWKPHAVAFGYHGPADHSR